MSRASEGRVAKRYANALFNAAQRSQRTDAVQADLDGLMAAWNASADFRRLMLSPRIGVERKKSLVSQLFAETTEPLTQRFLRLLIEKRREDVLPAVQEEFQRRADDARGLLRATAMVATPISPAEEEALRTSLAERTGRTVQLAVTVEPAIIGGVVVRMQDTVLDGSIRGALERIREHMLQDRM
jgi:F-type H+-transporting ATPase subunit delta